MFETEAKFKKSSRIILILVLFITGFLAFQIKNLLFDYDFEKFFPANDEETEFFFNYRQKFESDNDFLLIAIENKTGIFDKKFLKNLEKYSSNLKNIKNVESVTSILDQKQLFVYPGGLSASVPYLDSNFNKLKEDSVRIYNNKELINTFIAKDGESVCLLLKHTDYISKNKSDKLIKNIEILNKKFSFDRIRIAGKTIGQKYYVDKMSFEMSLFMGLSFILIILFLYIAFKSLWGVLLPQVVIIFAMLWIMGLMGLFHEPINLILVTLPSIMFVVSMSDVIHFVSRYLDALRFTGKKYESILITFKEVGMSTFLTSLTTAIGFYSLYFVNVQPIQIFGIITGTGVIVAFLLTISLLPVLIYLSPNPKFILKPKNLEGHFWKKYLTTSFIVILKNRKKALFFSFVVFIVSLLGTYMIDTDNYLMDDLKDGEELKKDFNFLDDHYGGVRPFELAITIKDTSKTVWDKEVLQEVDKLENYCEKVYGAKIKLSLVQILRLFNKASNSGDPNFAVLPTSQRKINQVRKPIRLLNKGKFYHQIIDSSETVFRVSGSIPDWGNHKVNDKNVKLKKFISENINASLIKVNITGTAHLFDKNIRYLSHSLVLGLLISIIIVAFIMGILYKSISMTLISIIPNILPLVIIAGIMGFAGIDLKVSTSIIFVIAFGIAVDDTIHFLGKFKLELNKGRSKIYALKRAYLTTGKAMILTTLILCAGFLLLILSSFLGTFYMGLLLCITLFAALIFDLTLLPVLILLFYKPKKKEIVIPNNTIV